VPINLLQDLHCIVTEFFVGVTQYFLDCLKNCPKVEVIESCTSLEYLRNNEGSKDSISEVLAPESFEKFWENARPLVLL
jgi:hypothetical protein